MKQNQQPATNTSPRTGVDRRPRDVTEARLVDHSVTADVRAGRPPQAKSGLWFAIVLTAFEIGASIAIFAYAVDHGASDVAAYLWACLGPLIGAVAYLIGGGLVNRGGGSGRIKGMYSVTFDLPLCTK